VPDCSDCDEGGVGLFRSDSGRNLQGLSEPGIEGAQGPVVAEDATFYLAATSVPEPALALLLALGICAALRRRR
jgi:hypothetical protein